MGADMKQWRTAVFGTGFMGRVHLEAIRRLGTVHVQVVNSRDESHCLSVLNDPTVDAVHICTPNALHFPMAKAALEAGKHVLCEKPLTTSVEDARALVAAAARSGRRNCLCHNLRYYPMVQQMRRLREAGDLGEILVVQGTYSQDWLLYDTDWNWRIDSVVGGPLRCMADIGTHWFDMAEHVTGQRVTSLCADLQTYHPSRKKPKGSVETFAGKKLQPDEYDAVPVSTDDFGSVIFRLGDRARGAMTASQVSAGCKNRLSIEVYGSKGSAAWNQ
jgi:predicted dehydrogenase